MTKLLSIISAILVVVFITGCAGKPINIETAAPTLYENVKGEGKEISATASGFQLLLLIPININSRQYRAYNSLKAQAAGGYITDVKIKESWKYAFVGTVYTTTITATVYPK